MIEIEIKAYCDSHEVLEQKIISLGGRFSSEGSERDLYFNHPSRDFGKTDEAFRIRDANGKCKITYKGPKIGEVGKSRYEKEVDISDPDAMSDVLNRLGFTESGTIIKKRKYYILDGVLVSLDNVEGIGLFAELEIMGEDVKKGEEKLLSLAKTLGLDRFERRSYLELAYLKG